MYRMTVKAWASILLCALFFAAAAAKPAYASESGDAVQQIPAAQETSAEQQSAEPDPSIPLRITAIDFGWEGWGDGTMIESKGECMLMDTFMPDCEDTLKEFLLDNGYTEFSLYLSHFHADHFGNMRNIMWDDRFKVKAVYMPDDAYMWATDNDYADLLGWFHSMDVAIKELAVEKGIPLIILRPGDSFRVGDAKVEILYGTTYESDDHDREYLNNNSLVARVTGGGIRYLTCGDTGKEVEKKILAEGIDVSADLYKMSHHGGDTGNSYEFMAAVNPSFGFFNSTDDAPDSFAYGWVEEPVSNLMEFANVYSEDRDLPGRKRNRPFPDVPAVQQPPEAEGYGKDAGGGSCRSRKTRSASCNLQVRIGKYSNKKNGKRTAPLAVFSLVKTDHSSTTWKM